MHPSICVHILPVSLWTLKTLLKQWMNDGSTGRYDSQIKSLSCVHFHTLESNHLKPRTNQLQLKKTKEWSPIYAFVYQTDQKDVLLSVSTVPGAI